MHILRSKESSENIPAYTIREANLEDAFAIAEINYKGRKNNFKGIIDQEYLKSLDLKIWNKRMTKKLENKKSDSKILVYTINNKVVWFIDGWVNRTPKQPYDAEIYALYVDPSVQGKGIGSVLIHEMMESEVFKKASSFYLRTLRDQKQSRHFYEKMWGQIGWEIEKEIGFKIYPMVIYYWKK